MQSLCLLNIERGRKIPKSYFIQLPQDGMFTVTKSQAGSQSDDDWKVDIHGGTCTCPAFLSSNIPCKHMFAVFHHFPKWSWDDLPKALTNSPHMTLDQNLTDASEDSFTPTCTLYGDNEQELGNSEEINACSFPSSNTTQAIPAKITEGAQVYRLQKQLEEVLGRCRTLAFLTNETSVLKALSHSVKQ